MELHDFSKLLDEKLNPIIERLDGIQDRLSKVENKLDKVLAFIPVGNEDVTKKLKKVAH